MRMIGKTTTAALAAAVALAMTAFTAFADKHFVGVWAVEDTSGAPFEITLSEDGKASGNRAGSDMVGTWEEKGDAVVISWRDGWTTKIAKDGDGYKKSAWKEGRTMDQSPTNTSGATKK